MKNKKMLYGLIGIGALAGLYFWNKNKKKDMNENISSEPILDTPITSKFDREKASKEFAGFSFPLINKANVGKPKESLSVIIDAKTGQQKVVKNPLKETITELFIYKRMLAMLNGISDDSDAEFTLNQFKKIYELGDQNYKPDLDTQIRFDKILKKYPLAVKEMDF